MKTLKQAVLYDGFCLFWLLMGLFAPSSAFAGHIVHSPNYIIPGGHGGSVPSRPVAQGLSVSCSPSAINANIGQTVTWFSSVTGGASGSYLYSWNGTDNVSGNTSTVGKIYTAAGEKFATLTVTSGGRATTVSCGSVQIGPRASFVQTQTPGFGASCYATPERVSPGETVTWLAIVSGVTASTTYEWDGTDNLSGNRPLISKIYAMNGVKSALLTVTNGSARIVAACTNAVTVGPKVPPKPVVVVVATTTPPVKPQTPEVKGLCAPSSVKAPLGAEVTWQVAAIGGTGLYQFLWSGDDDLIGTATTTKKSYETEGLKKASVVIASGSRTVTLSCTQVEITKDGNGLLAGTFFSKIDGPLCFILAALLALVIGVSIARRKRAKEDEEEIRDFKPTSPLPPAHNAHH